MGVKGGFFNALRPVMSRVQLRDLPRVRGRVVCALDASTWLHRLGRSVDPVGVMVLKEYEKLIDAFVERLGRLHGLGLSVLVVFDGASSSSKAATDQARLEKRQAAQAGLDELLAEERAGGTIDESKKHDLAASAFRRAAPRHT